MNPEATIEKLIQLKKIGAKTISAVLMFSCGVDIFPVDTLGHLICRRLGLVTENATIEEDFYLMRPIVPREKSFSQRMNLLRPGRTICLARKPSSNQFPIHQHYHFYSHHFYHQVH